MAGERAIIYCRVSSEKQAGDDKSSHDHQEQRCRQACAARGYTVAQVIHEVDKRWELDRAGLQQAIRAVREGAADVVMAMVMDRLSGDQRHLYIILEDIEGNGGRLEFADQQYEDSAFGRFLRNVYAFMSEVETERISARSRQGKQGAIDAGLHLGRVPLGFRKEGTGKNRKLVRDDATVPLVRRIFTDVAEGVPTRQVINWLEAEGHRTSIGGERWGPVSITRIIRNAKYKGVYQGGLTDTRKVRVNGRQKSVTRPRLEEDRGPTFPGPRVVPDELWAKANASLDRNQAESTRRNQNPETHLLRSGYAKCGVCGYNLIAKPGGVKRLPSYRCGTRRREGHRNTDARQDQLDALVWGRVELVANSPGQALKRMVEQAHDGTLDARLAELEGTVARLDKRLAGLSKGIANAYENDDESLAADLEGQRKPLLAAKADNDAELTGLRAQAERQAKLKDLPAQLEAILAEDPTQFHNLTHAQKRNLLARLGVRAEVLPAAPGTGLEDRVRVTMKLSPDLYYGWNQDDGDWDIDPEDLVGEALNILAPRELSAEEGERVATARGKLTPEQRKANEDFLKLTPEERRAAIADRRTRSCRRAASVPPSCDAGT